MRFYDLLQLEPVVIKNEIKNAKTKEEKIKACIALPVRPILIVLFAIAIIAPLKSIFGAENSAMIVPLFCILLGVRFVDFGYCIKESMINLGITFLLLLAAPVLAAAVNPILGLLINFVSLLMILIMTSDIPAMGNGGLFGFAYVFLAGNPVSGVLFIKRAILTLIGYAACGLIFYFKHKDKNKDVSFKSILSKFKLSSKKSQWQFRMALGIGFLLLIGRIFKVERLMWAGFACASMLSNYEIEDAKKKTIPRIIGTLIGMTLFFVIYNLTPDSVHSLLGPLCGICLGFCVDYKYKTAVNCFSALLIAVSIYGVPQSLMLRIFNNVFGVVFAYVFLVAFQKIVDWRVVKKEKAIA